MGIAFVFPGQTDMKRISVSARVALVSLLPAVSLLRASPASDEGPAAGGQIVSGLALPHWEEGECRENFEIRIWPRQVSIWLEEENLRSRIVDPAIPEKERESLKRILALQRAWRVRG